MYARHNVHETDDVLRRAFCIRVLEVLGTYLNSMQPQYAETSAKYLTCPFSDPYRPSEHLVKVFQMFNECRRTGFIPVEVTNSTVPFLQPLFTIGYVGQCRRAQKDFRGWIYCSQRDVEVER